MTGLLKLSGVSVGYGAIQVVKSLSMHVDKGEIVAVLGANGAGKSTLLRTISGVLRPSEGEITWRGEAIQGSPAHQIARQGIVHVPEGRGIFPELTVEETLLLGQFARPRGTPSARPKISLGDVFELFPILAERSRQLAGTLSGGQQQMLAISRGLLAQPLLLMLDEPLLGLSPALSQEVLARLRRIVSLGVAVLLVEQNASAAMGVADRVHVMSGGELVMEGTAEAVANAEGVHSAYLGATRGEQETRPRASAPDGAENGRALALEVEGVGIRFGGNVALDGVTLRVHEGEIATLIGPNGAGKSTLINCIAGFLTPDTGTIGFFGTELHGLPAHRRARLGLTRTFQNLQLFGTMTVQENVLAAIEASGSASNAAPEARRLLDLFEIGHLASSPTASLPYGIRKLVELARCIGTGARVLLLDEPAAGLNSAEKENMARILLRVIAERHLSVLLVEHDMPTVAMLADRVYVLDAGRMIADGTFSEVVRNPEVIKAYLGDAWK
ncbi:MAG: ATP-binding cassette domain-containing protein [Rhodospirillales bacterium]|nr:ATP-binding cassette domain-containing protein [Rhodospirillales bacterium]MDE2198355.1 ATP-binding cassette domain-containing protein [Rhodospirillales bacterium]